MKKRALATAAALSALTASLLSPAGPAQAASGSCSVAFGPKLAVDAPYEEFPAALKGDCAQAGVDFAAWDLMHQREGYTNSLVFDGTSRTSVDFYSFETLGGYTVRPDFAYSSTTDLEVPQNSFTVTVKAQSKASLSASRSGRTVTLSTAATYYNVGADRYEPFKGARVSFQVKTPQGWKTMGRVDSDEAGKATYRQTAGKATWRAVVQPTTRIWDRTTTTRAL
ncbi:hypothetical protein [uncultured Pseudokineococcus sp.]|uniref:hypothetical protein n=1 Tax=uncultured Pseudokineococcus sp. TaxID=1642928 RepID=UPI00262DEC88|nr:hypothetical protein [uncultured Pseudokineococcus sp.]